MKAAALVLALMATPALADGIHPPPPPAHRRIHMRLALAVLVIASATPVLAQTPCGERQRIVDALAEKYREAPVFMGISTEGYVTEIFGSADGGTWTAIMTMPGGRTCIMAAGKSWQAIPFKAPVAGQEM